MCRSIKQLRHPEVAPTDAEIHAAALQFVRKVSGYRAPSRRHQAAFDAAVDDIAGVTQRLLLEIAAASPAPRAPSPAQGEGAAVAEPSGAD